MTARTSKGAHHRSMRAQTMGSYMPTGRAIGAKDHRSKKSWMSGVPRCALSGVRVRVKSEHPRGPSLGTIIGPYVSTGGFWVSIPDLALHTVLRPSDWEML